MQLTFRILEMFAERYPNVFNSLSENLKLLNGGAVGIDIDAVTQATYVLALNKISHTLRKNIQKEDLVTYWELAKIAKDNGVDPDKAMELAKSAWNDDEVYANAPAMPGIKSFLQMLNEAALPYLFISSRPVEHLEATREWFRKELPWVKPENIILGRKEGMSGGEFKSGMINRYGVALHIEDAVEEAKTIAQETPAHVIIVPQPWNDNGRFVHPRIKYLGESSYSNGSWSVIRFLSGPQAKDFLSDKVNSFCVAQSH